MRETESTRTPSGRPVAAGGWRRMLIGLLLGILAGALVALVLPRDDGPRRVRPDTAPTEPGRSTDRSSPDPEPGPVLGG
ncbi:MAG: hypothetical protein JJT89_09200 [Nitriliruptoraceae bacterium]|nr:hypothetical protein [Nitriliruptoraceae bacterium]